MGLKRRFPFLALRLLVLSALTLSFFTACAGEKPVSTTSSTQDKLTYTNFGNLSARLFGLATFEGYNQTIEWPIEYAIPPISINWMGNIFNGLLAGAGPGGYTTYQVHGSVSDDGAWVETMFFSKKILNPNSNTGVFFRVTLQNVPLVRSLDESGSVQATSTKSGSDVQRFLTKVEYLSDPNFSYIGTNCGDTTCVAALNVTLAAGPGIKAGDGADSPAFGGSGGMM